MKLLLFVLALAVLGDCQKRARLPPTAFQGFQEEDLLKRNQVERDREEDFLNWNEPPQTTTPKGTFIGVKETINGKDVVAFYGIPYAKPPTGNLRFKRPVSADKLEEPFHANQKPAACPQMQPNIFKGFKGETMWTANVTSEDCLYLNIWVPAKIFENKSRVKVPVFFWIYGGGFYSGSSSLDVYDGGVLAATQDLVVVSHQYRLGPLGFLYLGSEEAPGNMGLIDQALALQWTQETIKYFGGDAQQVTIAGESCGSSAVGFHLVSPLTKGSFKRAIMMSGLPNAEYAYAPPEVMKARSLKLAKHAGCDQQEAKEIIECLSEISGDKLEKLQWRQYKQLLHSIMLPTTDNYFLKDEPSKVVEKGRAKRAEIMVGSTKDEGTYFLLYHYLKYLSHDKAKSIPYETFLDMMDEQFEDFDDKQREAIISEYTNWEDKENGLTNLYNLGEAVGDKWFTCPIKVWADKWANRGLSVYHYHLTERLKSNPWAEWMGVMHADDVPILFGEALIKNSTYSEREREMVKNFMGLIGQFVKTGVPSENWEKYTSEHPAYLEVNATVITDESRKDKVGPKANECAFWNNVLPLIKEENEGKEGRKMKCEKGSKVDDDTRPLATYGF